MSDSFSEGKACYEERGEGVRAWFERQWAIWPTRADERLTTNIAFHYGGVVAYRAEHGVEPKLSRDFASHVAWHDRHQAKQKA